MYKHSLSRFKSRAVWCPWNIEVHNQPKPNTRHGQFSLPPSLMVKSTAQREQHKGRETYSNPVWTHMRSKHSNQQLNIERHKEWNMTGQLSAASSRDRRLHAGGQGEFLAAWWSEAKKAALKGSRLLYVRSAPAERKKCSEHPSYTVPPAWGEHAHTNMQTQDAHTNQK